MNINKIKKAIQEALFLEYGFKPALKDIQKLEFADGMHEDEITAWFEINHIEYEYDTILLDDGELYTGDGTIAKM